MLFLLLLRICARRGALRVYQVERQLVRRLQLRRRPGAPALYDQVTDESASNLSQLGVHACVRADPPHPIGTLPPQRCGRPGALACR